MAKQESAGGVYIRADELGPDNSWVDRVVERFGRAKVDQGVPDDAEKASGGLKLDSGESR